MRVCTNPHTFFTYTLYGILPYFTEMLLFSIADREVFRDITTLYGIPILSTIQMHK